MSTKKLAVVTLVSLVGLALVAAIGGYVYLRYFSPRAPVLEALSNVAIAGALEREIRNHARYVAPPGGGVTDEQLGRFFKVEEQIEAALGGRTAAFQNACDQLERIHAEGHGLTVQRALEEVGGIGSAFRTAKRAQIDALNAANLSREEYEWVRRQLYAAAGIELAQIDLEDLRQFTSVEDRVRVRTRAPLTSIASDARHQVDEQMSKLRRWRALAFFGL